MHQFQKNGLFSDQLLNTLISVNDKPPLKGMIYLNFSQLSWEKRTTQLHFYLCEVNVKNDVLLNDSTQFDLLTNSCNKYSWSIRSL